GVFGDPDYGAVLAPHLRLESGDITLACDQVAEVVAAAGIYVQLSCDVAERNYEILGGVKAVDASQGRIGTDVLSVGRGLKDALDGVLEDAAVLFFGN